MSGHTPEQWRRDGLTVYALRMKRFEDGRKLECNVFSATVSDSTHQATPEELEANARLMEAAPNHALIARLLSTRQMRWELLCGGPDGELCFDGLRHYTEPDEFGVPKLTEYLRERIAKAGGRL